ncbi:hypothetical protein [uncultured Pelagimonas sp.]|uniref:hypothetical protein n=1 Tax=uncultured Pelagimonas sp. TaxID=1618102 RepID=UPI0026195FF5|nr:hypothetical protein [uncultured Pelagimonas sp.]
MRFQNLVAGALLCLASAVSAQENEPIFDTYESMRAEMDRLMVTRDIQTLMLSFGGGDEMTPQQLNQLDVQVEQLYPVDFQNVAVVRKGNLQGGFHQELLAYWTGTFYIYAYVLYHDRGSDVVSVNFRFNSDFSALNSLF